MASTHSVSNFLNELTFYLYLVHHRKGNKNNLFFFFPCYFFSVTLCFAFLLNIISMSISQRNWVTVWVCRQMQLSLLPLLQTTPKCKFVFCLKIREMRKVIRGNRDEIYQELSSWDNHPCLYIKVTFFLSINYQLNP